MFVKRNTSRQGDKTYTSTLLVEGQRVPVKRGRGRPSKDAKPRTTVVHQTLANLSKLPEPLVALIERYCERSRNGEPLDDLCGDSEPVIGPVYGQMAATLSLARQLGIEAALGKTPYGRLALFLVLARVIHRGSRLSAVRWAETQAVAQVLELPPFDEDSLYRTLNWLEEQQQRIEKKLVPKASPSAVFLYDVTSSYFEGQQNELAAAGYNRDGKRFKKQVVVGLLTDQDGEPCSIQVYPGNTADPATIAGPIRKLVEHFGAKDVIFVGDRGMIKAKGKQMLAAESFHYVSSLTVPEIRRLLRDGPLQLELFDTKLVEVQGADGLRYVLHRNEATQERTRSRRADQLAKVRAKVEARNVKTRTSLRTDPAVSLRHAETWLGKYHLGSWVKARLDEREVLLEIDEEAKTQLEALDGCYAVVSDVPAEVASAETLWQRYGDLQKVERDFRTLKTGLLEIRPIYLRKANRTRAHAFVAMLALKIVRALAQRVQSLGLSAEEAIERLGAVRLVTVADPKLGLWRLPSRWVGPEREVLAALPPLPPPMLSLATIPA